MKFCLVLCVASLIIGVYYADILADVTANTKLCSDKYNYSDEEAFYLRNAVDKYSIPASDNLKCFMKCAIEKNNEGLTLERHVEVMVATGHDEAKARLNYEKCKNLKSTNTTCDESWNLYACLFQQ